MQSHRVFRAPEVTLQRLTRGITARRAIQRKRRAAAGFQADVATWLATEASAGFCVSIVFRHQLMGRDSRCLELGLFGVI